MVSTDFLGSKPHVWSLNSIGLLPHGPLNALDFQRKGGNLHPIMSLISKLCRQAHRSFTFQIFLAGLVSKLVVSSLLLFATSTKTSPPEILIVGSGISGLSAALEAGKRGVSVTVIDLWSTFGGHAVIAGGLLSIVGSPLQKANGIEDTPQSAYRNFMEWGEDANPEWVRYYVDNSAHEIYDWLTELGVVFYAVDHSPGNSVARGHQPKGGGLALVRPIYQECLKYPNIRFIWNHRVVDLIQEGNRVTGIVAKNLRTQEQVTLSASSVVLATGGFQSNLHMVRDFWPQKLKFPETLLYGSGPRAVGSGHKLAAKTGAVLTNMDHQWNYSTGIPDPRYPGSGRGMFARIAASIWVNSEGKRFVNESASYKVTFPAVVNQKGSEFWAIFDQSGLQEIEVRGTTAWEDPLKVFLERFPKLIVSADSLDELGRMTGLPPTTLRATVKHYNALVEQGIDTEFGRFGTAPLEVNLEPFIPQKIETPPYHALHSFPLTRKSMGGVKIDQACRVLTDSGKPISGLYAVGELTGFAGVNGKAGLEGTFLGPSILTGRIAGRSIPDDLDWKPLETPHPRATAVSAPETKSTNTANETCLQCHQLRELIRTARSGFEHFNGVHKIVLERAYPCTKCHVELTPIDMSSHKLDPYLQSQTCQICH